MSVSSRVHVMTLEVYGPVGEETAEEEGAERVPCAAGDPNGEADAEGWWMGRVSSLASLLRRNSRTGISRSARRVLSMRPFTSDVEKSPISVGEEGDAEADATEEVEEKDEEADEEATENESIDTPAPAKAAAPELRLALLTIGIAEIFRVSRIRRMSTTDVESDVVSMPVNVPMFSSRTVRLRILVS